ncbi:MAG: acyltransferase [Gammaproteobacteria bacterium]|nr:acyltransferase [Gammaproteobacteria bacterium]
MKKRNIELDRLRAFAVIMTVVIHYARVFFPWNISPEYQQGTSILNIWKNSWTGVDLFFVISGYIICKTIVQHIDQLQSSKIKLVQFIKSFYLRRIYRIYPVACVIFFFVLICSFIFNQGGYFGTPENTIEAGISIFTYTFNYYFAYHSYHAFPLSPYWSLSVEEQFYLILPLFLIMTNTARQRVLLLLAILLLITFYIRPYSQTDSIFLTQTRCDGLIYGCLVYFLTIQPWFSTIMSDWLINKYSRIWITFFLILLLSSITALGFSNSIVIPIACLLSAILVSLAAFERNIIIAFPLIERSLDYLGTRSYSLYLVHFPMFSLTQEIMHRLSQANGFTVGVGFAWHYTILAFGLTAISTELLYRFVELPFIEKGRNLSKILGDKPIAKNELVTTTQIS